LDARASCSEFTIAERSHVVEWLESESTSRPKISGKSGSRRLSIRRKSRELATRIAVRRSTTCWSRRLARGSDDAWIGTTAQERTARRPHHGRCPSIGLL